MSTQKKKGTAFESAFVDYERAFFNDSEGSIRRLAMSGANDCGDVGGLYAHGLKIAVECKDRRRYELREWLSEAERERGNYDADLGVVVFHLNGVGVARMGEQAVLMTVDTFNRLIGG